MRTSAAVLIVASSLITVLSCGGGGSSNPTGPPPQGNLQIHTRIAALRVGETEDVTTNVSGGGDVTGVAVLTSSDTSVFIVEDNRRVRGVGPGRAELRATYQTLTAQVPQMVVTIGPTPNRTDSIPSPVLVINEFRTSGPSGERDEFIELRNVSDSALDVAGWSIALVTSTGHRESLGILLPGDSVVNPGCHFLLTGVSGPNAYSSGSIAVGDFRWASSFFGDDVSFALIDPAGRIADQVGIANNAEYREGTPLTPLVGRSRERTMDSNDNATDFRPSAQDSPRNRQSGCN